MSFAFHLDDDDNNDVHGDGDYDNDDGYVDLQYGGRHLVAVLLPNPMPLLDINSTISVLFLANFAGYQPCFWPLFAALSNSQIRPLSAH